MQAWVKCNVANVSKLIIADGVSTIESPFHTGSGEWEKLSAEGSIEAAATKIDVQLFVAQAGTGETNQADFDLVIFDESINDAGTAIASLRHDLADALKRIRVLESA